MSAWSPFRRYGLAVAAVALACLVQWIFWLTLQDAHFMLYLTAVLMTALAAGWGPGLLALGLSWVKIKMFHESPLPFVVTGNPMNIRGGIFLLLSLVIIGVCERQRRARRREQVALKEAQFLQRRFQDVLSVVSHDLRNPLSAILLNATLLKRNGFHKLSSEALIRQADLIQAAGQRLNSLIEDLLINTRSEIGALRLNQEPEDPNVLIEDAIKLQSPIAERKRIQFRTEVLAASGHIYCDRATVLQALSNLIENAIRVTPPEGEVTIRTEDHNLDQVRFTVLDQGPGISPRELARALDRYEQAQKSPPARGLSVARGIAESHGGHLGAGHRSGGGTEVYFTLPRHHVQLEAAQKAA